MEKVMNILTKNCKHRFNDECLKHGKECKDHPDCKEWESGEKMENEIKWIKEMKEEGYSLKQMKEKFEELESKYHFDDCWEEAHKQEKPKEKVCKRCEKLKDLINRAEVMGYDNLFIKTIKKDLFR